MIKSKLKALYNMLKVKVVYKLFLAVSLRKEYSSATECLSVYLRVD